MTATVRLTKAYAVFASGRLYPGFASLVKSGDPFWELLFNLYAGQPRELADIVFLEPVIGLHGQTERLADLLGGLLCTQQWAAINRRKGVSISR